MSTRVAIENIENMRRRQGIEDVELREAIRGLRAGDFVKLTFLSGTDGLAGETLLVRITSVRGDGYRGKLADQPASSGLTELHVGSLLAFTGSQIHSLPKGRQKHERD